MDGNQPMTVDNKFLNKLRSGCGIQGVHVYWHKQAPSSAYSQVNNQLECLWVSANLLDALQGSVSLALGVGNHSNQTVKWADFEINALFNGSINDKTHAARCNLIFSHPTQVTKYKKELLHKLISQNMFARK